MNKVMQRWAFGMAALVLGGGASVATAVPTLTTTLTVVTLPSTITLCRDQNAIAQYGADAQWQVFIDADHNAGTGDPFGSDVLLVVTTEPQDQSCVPHTANTQASLGAFVLVWDPNLATFNVADAAASVAIDTGAGTLAITTKVVGPLQNLSSSAPLRLSGLSTYTASGGPTFAADGALGAIGAQTTDPAQDVQTCTTPCTQTASWIKMIDIVGVAAAPSEPLPAFGANTVTVEFDLASLPANLSLCRYPAAFANGSGSDYGWLAGFDVDANPNTGPGGIDSQIVISSPVQAPACTTHSAAIGAALSADLEVWDDQQQTYVFVADLPLTIDVAAGKLFVQADRTAQGLAGLSSTSLIGEQTVGVYSFSDPSFAYDPSPLLHLGVAFVDPLHDVLACTSPCSTAVDWYPQIDLIGGSIHLNDAIFGSGFE